MPGFRFCRAVHVVASGSAPRDAEPCEYEQDTKLCEATQRAENVVLLQEV